MSLRGSFSSLHSFTAALRSIGSGLVANRVATIAAPKLSELAQASASASQASDGTPWRPSAEGGKVTLRKSGSMLSRLVYVAIGPKLRVALTTRYAKYQIGPRTVFPTQGTALPKPYLEALESSVVEAFAAEGLK